MPSVSKSWLRRLRGAQQLWEHFIRREFAPDSETLTLATQKAVHMMDEEGTPFITWYTFGLLARRRSCQRCQLDYCDGNNPPTACRFHSGVLFSGGRLNGNGLVWSCCNKRSYHTTTFQRHAMGCTASRHVGGVGRSLWTTDGADCKPRPLSLERKGSSNVCLAKPRRLTALTSNVLGAWSGSTTALEWHPDRYPHGGVVAVPSKVVLADAQSIQICF